MSKMILKMRVIDGTFGVCRLSSMEKLPNWIEINEFYSITKTEDELSIVCSDKNIPNEITHENDWKIIKVEGPLDFSLTGVLSSLSTALANQGISIFAISTYDTDYILVKNKDIENAINVLSKEGHQI